jgi:hypothetical protein
MNLLFVLVFEVLAKGFFPINNVSTLDFCGVKSYLFGKILSPGKKQFKLVFLWTKSIFIRKTSLQKINASFAKLTVVCFCQKLPYLLLFVLLIADL